MYELAKHCLSKQSKRISSKVDFFSEDGEDKLGKLIRYLGGTREAFKVKVAESAAGM